MHTVLHSACVGTAPYLEVPRQRICATSTLLGQAETPCAGRCRTRRLRCGRRSGAACTRRARARAPSSRTSQTPGARAPAPRQLSAPGCHALHLMPTACEKELPLALRWCSLIAFAALSAPRSHFVAMCVAALAVHPLRALLAVCVGQLLGSAAAHSRNERPHVGFKAARASQSGPRPDAQPQNRCNPNNCKPVGPAGTWCRLWTTTTSPATCSRCSRRPPPPTQRRPTATAPPQTATMRPTRSRSASRPELRGSLQPAAADCSCVQQDVCRRVCSVLTAAHQQPGLPSTAAVHARPLPSACGWSAISKADAVGVADLPRCCA